MSITLATPYSISGPAGLVATQTAPNAACLSYLLNPLEGTITVYFGLGTAAVTAAKTTGWTPGAQTPSLSATLTLSTGAWTASNGPSGTLTSAQVAEAQAVLLQGVAAIQNLAEALAAALGIIPGTISDTW